MSSYNTNLAAEFYVLSMLHRLGAEANLTLGNKKSVDIVVVRGEGNSITIDVKGLAGTTGWPVDNLGDGNERHFIVFVCFLDKIQDPEVVPHVWVVPSLEVDRLKYLAPGGRKLVRVSELRAKGGKFKDAWTLIV
ncbi:MAG: hypothetical protein ABSG53_22375 [Thermoguttaceae bacterium]|jgi:hypothetical protein